MTAKANLEHSQGIARHKEDNNERKITNTKVIGTQAKQKKKKKGLGLSWFNMANGLGMERNQVHIQFITHVMWSRLASKAVFSIPKKTL